MITDDDKARIVKQVGYHQLWHLDNWVAPNSPDPDHSGMSLDDAFERSLAVLIKVYNDHKV